MSGLRIERVELAQSANTAPAGSGMVNVPELSESTDAISLPARS